MAILINAVLLYILVSTFGSHSDSSLRWKVLLIAVVSGVAETLAAPYLTTPASSIVGLLGAALLVSVLLFALCKLPAVTVAKVAGIYIAVRVAIAIVLGLVVAAV